MENCKAFLVIDLEKEDDFLIDHFSKDSCVNLSVKNMLDQIADNSANLGWQEVFMNFSSRDQYIKYARLAVSVWYHLWPDEVEFCKTIFAFLLIIDLAVYKVFPYLAGI